MTEADWATAADPAGMLTLAAPRVSDRKLRLYLVGCCRRRWELFADERCRGAVEIAERVADGRATDGERVHGVVLAREGYEQAQWDRDREQPIRHYWAVANAAWATCERVVDLRRGTRGLSEVYAADGPTRLAEVAAALATPPGGGHVPYEAALVIEQADQADLLRCVFGDPFVYTLPDPSWRTSAALGLAAAIYADRAFDRLPILADALEEAGCGDPDVLRHCRRDREHARGCWVVDLLLDQS